MLFRVLSISFFLLIFSCCVTSCVSNIKNVAPVVDLDTEYAKQKGYYTVSAGETLYLISWRFDMNYQDLAEINHISPPYKLEVGEKIYLPTQKSPNLSADEQGSSVSNMSSKQADNRAEVKRKRVSEGSTTASDVGRHVQGKKTAKVSKAVKPTPVKIVPKKSAKVKTVIKSKSVKSVLSSSQSHSTTSKPIKFTAVKHWIWPAKGKVVGRYSQSNKGINIAGKEGENVLACAAGEVVYAGSGLRAYGNLLIIKHNDTYLSAYAHNENLMVKEGSYVKQGQVIAHLGSTGTTRPMLHFEIRKQGKPVDPLKYLP